MPTAPYMIGDTRVPGVTTVIGRFKESGGLIHWAWDLGRQGKDYREERDKAASAGTGAHHLFEAFLRNGGEVDIDATLEPLGLDEDWTRKAKQGYQSFLAWVEQTKLEVLDTEMHLVSKEHRFGGTPDAIGISNGELCLIDWKTSNKTYPDYVVQLAAYRMLYEECSGEKLYRAHLLRVGKDYADFHHHSWPMEVMDLAWQSFLLMRALYEQDKQLKKLV